MTPDLIWKALFLGLLNAAPIGPVGLMCLKKNVEPHRLPGMMAGAGMAAAYAIISFCVLFGLNGIGQWLNDYKIVCQLLAGAALIVIGWRGLKKERSSVQTRPCPKSLVGDFSQSFAMTLLNPVPFASFAFILTSFDIVRGELDLFTDLIFAGFVFAGTLLFWAVANQILHWLKHWSAESHCRWITRGSSVALIVFGAVIFLKGALDQSLL
ncbi:MAG: LysE family transporter [Verrucomicrobiales bacterium]|nr:LysE family transporter [Verrucomicrobiales bacterium]